jgi:PAS domain S-box-containing protein/diguanylate cyclase (GGDEF)-like protein
MKFVYKIISLYVLISILWVFTSEYNRQNFLNTQHFYTYYTLIYVCLTSIFLFILTNKLTKDVEKERIKKNEADDDAEKFHDENIRLMQVFNQVSTGLVLTDAKKRDLPIIYVNETFVQMTGYAKEEIIGKNCRFLQGEHTHASNRRKIKEAIEKEESIQIEIVNYRKNGERFWNELKISPIKDSNGEVTYFVGIQNDITEKKNQSILLENQFQIVKSLLMHEDYMEAFREICLIIEKHMDYQCIIFQKDLLEERIHVLASGTLPEAFHQEISDFPIRPNEGVTGEAIYEKETKIVSDVNQHLHNEKYKRIAEDYGIQSIWSTPVLSAEGQVFGAITMYKKTPYIPTKSEVQTIETYAYILSLVMENIRIQDKLKRSEEKYRLITENVTDIICLLDSNFHIEYISKAINLLTTDDRPENIIRLFSDETYDKTMKYLRYLIESDEDKTLEISLNDVDGNPHWFDLKGTKITNDRNEVNVLLVARDITASKQYQASLDNILYIDTLSQLPNKYKFRKELERLLQEDSFFYMVMLDFDHLKDVKHMYGIEIWDHIILEMKQLISDIVKPNLLAKTGEDEFCFVILHDTEKTLMEKLLLFLNHLKKPIRIQYTDLLIEPRIGVVSNQKQSAGQMLTQAQESIQSIVGTTMDPIAFYDKQVSTSINRVALIKRSLSKAIDNNEFTLVYQPQVNIQTKKITGLEALIRWENDELGNVPPGEFITIAEETGWITAIGDYVINQVLQDIQEWIAQGKEYRVSINISYRQLMEVDFIDKLVRALTNSACPSHLISLEITEHSLLEDIHLSTYVLEQVHDLGIQVEVDDFGVGYSSLSYLRKLPLDVLKIDRSFIQNVHTDRRELAVVQAIMEMSRALQLQVIAEGVETKKQVELLHELGCDKFQGYYFSKPIPKEKLQEEIEIIYETKLK